MELTAENQIGMFVHCGKCIDEIASGAAGTNSPREYAQLEIGFTKPGLQVWCRRHDVNVMYIDFQGAKHPANMDV